MQEINYMKKFQDDATVLNSSLNISGRFSFQREAMKRVVPDIINKLELKPTDSLLDVGCNCGDITVPLSFLCDEVVGIDGEGCLERLKKRIEDIENITTLSGNFLDVTIEKKFDCVLIYSVLMYCSSFEEIKKIVIKGANALKTGGRMLVGDIVNQNKKERFEASSIGQRVNEEYRINVSQGTEEDIISHTGEGDGYRLNDKMIMELICFIREEGYEVYLLPQDENLPFGYTREDILVINQFHD